MSWKLTRLLPSVAVVVMWPAIRRPDEADDLLVGQPLPVHLGLDQLAGEVGAPVGPSGLDVVQEVGVHLPHRRRDGLQRLLADLGHRLVGVDLLAEQHVGPLAEQSPVGGGNAEQLGDHDHRQRVRQRVDQVEPLANLVQQLGCQLGDARLQAGHDPWGERLADQCSQLAVLRRIHLDEVAALKQL